MLQQREEITHSVFGGYKQINTSVTTHCCKPADPVSQIYDDSEDNFADPQTPHARNGTEDTERGVCKPYKFHLCSAKKVRPQHFDLSK